MRLLQVLDLLIDIFVGFLLRGLRLWGRDHRWCFHCSQLLLELGELSSVAISQEYEEQQYSREALDVGTPFASVSGSGSPSASAISPAFCPRDASDAFCLRASSKNPLGSLAASAGLAASSTASDTGATVAVFAAEALSCCCCCLASRRASRFYN